MDTTEDGAVPQETGAWDAWVPQGVREGETGPAAWIGRGAQLGGGADPRIIAFEADDEYLLRVLLAGRVLVEGIGEEAGPQGAGHCARVREAAAADESASEDGSGPEAWEAEILGALGAEGKWNAAPPEAVHFREHGDDPDPACPWCTLAAEPAVPVPDPDPRQPETLEPAVLEVGTLIAVPDGWLPERVGLFPVVISASRAMPEAHIAVCGPRRTPNGFTLLVRAYPQDPADADGAGSWIETGSRYSALRCALLSEPEVTRIQLPGRTALLTALADAATALARHRHITDLHPAEPDARVRLARRRSARRSSAAAATVRGAAAA